jgi:CRP-like cAMP-binding protein
VDNLLARSPIFGKLPAEDRRALLPQFNLRMFERGATVIQEGDVNDQIYLIKSGTAEVFTEKGGPRTQLSTIGPGTVFGEVAALRQVPRTASVTAATALETLELSGTAFHRVLDSKPDVRKRILDVVAQRARENMDKVMGPSPFARNLPPR